MKKPNRLAVLTIECLALSLCFGSAVAEERGSIESTAVDSKSATTPRAEYQPAGTWLVDRSDSICGLDDSRMLSRPARVDYEDLVRSTPEMKRMRDEKIDPNTSEGIQLRQFAVDRVRRACERVRATAGHCSVWKEIRHSEGKTAPDVTELVRKEL